ncbi:FmdB family zinc ribbon protein [Candidatus Protofrankia californiensis]|uniref:FmdB family zinc ribbon protein n=1 Tax=Candidatus Protofrankia californiensis TaxID=1839754 RepID=UPI001040E9C3|nr:zinc ribbon domain-containing protein [Candidatus Protofrankia californiensis]
MPAYQYRCRTCDTSFEVRRGITEPAAVSNPCPGGHTDTSRVFTAVAVSRAGSSASPTPTPSGGGVCCGGGCCG